MESAAAVDGNQRRGQTVDDVVGRLRGLTAHTGVASKLRAQPPRRNVGAATAARAPHPFNAASADVVVPD